MTLVYTLWHASNLEVSVDRLKLGKIAMARWTQSVSFVSLSALVLCALTARADDDCQTPAFSSSFSPITAVDATGAPVCLEWTYRINGGIPLAIETDVSLVLDFDDLVLRIDPADLVREADIYAVASGDASGTVTGQVDSELSSLVGGTFVESQTIALTLSLSAQGVSCDTLISIGVAFNPSAEWFLDREGLDEFPIGFVYDEQGTVSASVDGFVEISCPPLPPISTALPETTAQSVEKWVITGKEASLTVGGTTYANVVHVTRHTIVPDENGNPEVAEIQYWVARGVGMVKGIGQFEILGEPLTIELIGTNVPEPSRAVLELAALLTLAILRRRSAAGWGHSGVTLARNAAKEHPR